MAEPFSVDYEAGVTLIDLPSGAKDLHLKITMKCPHCGEIVMELPGHHIRMIRDTLIKIVDDHPDRCQTGIRIDNLKPPRGSV